MTGLCMSTLLTMIKHVLPGGDQTPNLKKSKVSNSVCFTLLPFSIGAPAVCCIVHVGGPCYNHTHCRSHDLKAFVGWYAGKM